MESIFDTIKSKGLSALELFNASIPDFFKPSITLEDLPAVKANEQASLELESQRDQLGLTASPDVVEQEQSGVMEDPNAQPQEVNPIQQTLDNPAFNQPTANTGGGNTPTASNGSVVAQVTRYGFQGDKYQSKRATTAGSSYENIGNRNNILEAGVSVALPPMTAKALGINSKRGDFVEANIGGKWQRFRVDDTTANHKNHRIDFFDPTGKRVKMDGNKIEIRKVK